MFAKNIISIALLVLISANAIQCTVIHKIIDGLDVPQFGDLSHNAASLAKSTATSMTTAISTSVAERRKMMEEFGTLIYTLCATYLLPNNGKPTIISKGQDLINEKIGEKIANSNPIARAPGVLKSLLPRRGLK